MDDDMKPTLRTLFAWTLVALVVSLPGSFSALAQDEPPPEGEGRKRIEDYRRIKLIETLDLKEEQAVRFLTREKEFRESERAMMDERQAAIKRLQAAVKDGNDADIQKEINGLLQIGKDMIQKRSEYFLGLKDLLTTKQMAKLMIFEDNFAKELRRILQAPRMRERMRDR
jgi:hypothetical protein